MEALLNALTPIAATFADNYWLMILIIAFLCSKSNRIAGFLILTMMVYIGYNPIIFGIIIFVSICTDFLNPKTYYKNEYNRKVEDLENRYNSNVIQMHQRED